MAHLSGPRAHLKPAVVVALGTGMRMGEQLEGLIWKDLKATFGTRLAEAGCDALTIAQLLGHSDVRVTMRYVIAVEDTKRVPVEAIKLSARKNVQVNDTERIQDACL